MKKQNKNWKLKTKNRKLKKENNIYFLANWNEK
jgi:hypothetical protein